MQQAPTIFQADRDDENAADERVKWLVRPATPADSHAILQCLREAFEPFRAQYTGHAFNDTVPSLEAVQARMTAMISLVATDDAGEVAGTISAAVIDANEGHLRGMAVRPAWQGTPVASLLLGDALARLKKAGCREVTLDTTHPLTRAIRFYERHGFVATGKVSDFFGMPLLQYRRELE